MTLTKRDLVVRISEEIKQEQEDLEKEQLKQEKTTKEGTGKRKAERQKLGQQQILDVVQKALDYIVEALAKGDKVELRNFGVFEVKVRKARIGRNPNAPSTDVPIPERSVVKFKAGKEMRAQVLKLPPELPSKSPGQPTQA
jgi:nucleoid DNA-binding protein